MISFQSRPPAIAETRHHNRPTIDTKSLSFTFFIVVQELTDATILCGMILPTLPLLPWRTLPQFDQRRGWITEYKIWEKSGLAKIGIFMRSRNQEMERRRGLMPLGTFLRSQRSISVVWKILQNTDIDVVVFTFYMKRRQASDWSMKSARTCALRKVENGWLWRPPSNPLLPRAHGELKPETLFWFALSLAIAKVWSFAKLIR